MARQREARLTEHDKQQMALGKSTLESQDEYRKSQIAAREAATQAAQEKAFTGAHLIGDELTPEDARTYSQYAVPGVVAQQGAQIGVDENDVPQYDVTPGKSATFKGSVEQRQAADDKARRKAYLKTLDPSSQQAKFLSAQEALGDDSLPYQMFQDEKAGRIIVRDGKTGQMLVQDPTTKQMRPFGPADAPFDKSQDQLVNDDPAEGAGGSGRGFVIPVQTGNGVIVLDGRTGKPIDRYDLKPGEGAQENLTRAKMVLYDIGQIEQSFTPARVGPLKGRYNTMQLALVGEAGDAGLADMQSTISTLQNTVINLRTGAQMSEPEAQRIMKEIPSMNLPPDVFMARLNKAKQYFGEYLNTRSTMAYGRGTVPTNAAGAGMTPAPPVGAGAVPGVVAPGVAPARSDPMADLYNEYLNRGR
jgi:hypothetical protein